MRRKGRRHLCQRWQRPIINSTFFGNSGVSGGSALLIRNGASVTAINSTFADGYSYQVRVLDSSTLSLNNSMIVGNSSPLCVGTVTVQNSLIRTEAVHHRWGGRQPDRRPKPGCADRQPRLFPARPQQHCG
ncbi:MAG: hypothetical protein R3E79_51300 [Caldilineaceae bacterium]